MTGVAAWALLKRLWWLPVIAGLAIALLVTRGTLATRSAELRAAIALYDQLAADVRAKTAEAEAADRQHKAAVEADQDKVTNDHDKDLRSQLADARARADDLSRRLRGASQADPGGGEGTHLPGAADAAGGADGARSAAVVASDNAACAENAVKAQGWLDWWREVSAIPR